MSIHWRWTRVVSCCNCRAIYNLHVIADGGTSLFQTSRDVGGRQHCGWPRMERIMLLMSSRFDNLLWIFFKARLVHAPQHSLQSGEISNRRLWCYRTLSENRQRTPPQSRPLRARGQTPEQDRASLQTPLDTTRAYTVKFRIEAGPRLQGGSRTQARVS